MADRFRCILLVAMMVLLQGCAFFDSDHEYFDIYYSLEEPASDEGKEDFEYLEEIYDSRLPEEYFSDDYGYYHQFLNREEAFMYRALLRGCINYRDEIALDPISTESYLKVAQVFMMDHPEFY
ncbi:MAG: hypothetical protein IKD69_04895, partial [Solobacterium sp.]|nr:hypothetical protein [Solobacterium sp.]